MTAAERLRERRARHRERPFVVRVVVALGGFATLLGGIALLVLPGPGIPLVVVGLGLLALEFRWAEAALCACAPACRAVRPSTGRQRVAAGAAMLAALGASAGAVALWGLPGL